MAKSTTWAAAILFLVISGTASAQSRWEAIRQNAQQPAARLQLPGSGLLRGVALTCDKGRPLMALRLATPPAPRAARGRLMVGGVIHEIGLARVGTTETWAVPITDAALLSRLAAGNGIATLHITGAPAVGFPLTGADTAFPEALSGCYRPAADTAATTPSARPHTSGGGLSPVDAAAIEKVVRRAYAYDDGSPPVMTRRVTAVAAECEALQPRYDKKFGEAASFGMCHDDAGALCECQDLDDDVLKRTLRVATISIGTGRARVTARFALFPGRPADRSVTLELVKTAAGWQIDHVGNEQQQQLEGIAHMRKRLGLPVWTPPPVEVPAS